MPKLLSGAMKGLADSHLLVGQGTVPGKQQRQVPGHGLIVLIAVTQTGTLPMFEQVLRRSWKNTGYLLAETQNVR